MNLDRSGRAEESAREALAIYQREGDSRGAARVLDVRAMATFLEGGAGPGTRLLRQVANLFEDSGDLMRVVTPRSTCGHGLVFMGRPGEGLREATSALEIARSLGQPEGQAYALWHRSEALSALGEGTSALEAGQEALAIATRIDHRGWTATAWRAIGIAEQSLDVPESALQSFRNSLELSENLDLFGCWALARAALVSVTLGRLDDAAALADRALSTGPGIGQYEARLARVEVAVARCEPEAQSLAEGARRRAEAGGVMAHLPRLTDIIDASQEPVR
jgi:tetratricopeptide (TPR) repeat protein